MNELGVGRPIEILLVEDSPGDVRLTREALKEGKVLNKLHVTGDGVQAMEFLRRLQGFADSVYLNRGGLPFDFQWIQGLMLEITLGLNERIMIDNYLA